MFLRYILATHEHIDRTALREAVNEAVSPRAEDAVVTMYEQLIEEGRQKGLAQGLQKGRAEVLLQLLAEKFGRVPAAAREQVRGAEPTVLMQWTKNVLTARTLEAALAEAPARKAARPAPKKKIARR